MEIFGQNPMLKQFGAMRPLPMRLAGLKALQALKKQKLRGRKLAVALTELARTAGIVRNEIEANHLLEDWLGGWFPGRPVPEIFLESFLQAAKLALADQARPLSIDAYWAASHDGEVSAAVARSEQQVTVVLFTPEPARKTRVRALKEKDPVWVVTASGKRVTMRQNAMTALAKT
jgi:hypothetical protein